jgi:hypothetical protein
MQRQCHLRAHQPPFVLTQGRTKKGMRAIETPAKFPRTLVSTALTNVIMSPERRASLNQAYLNSIPGTSSLLSGESKLRKLASRPGRVFTPRAYAYTSSLLPQDCQFWQLVEDDTFQAEGFINGLDRMDPVYMPSTEE